MSANSIKVSTTIGNPRLIFQIDPKVIKEPDYLWFKEYLESTISDGVVYKNGEMIQVGAMGVMMVANTQGELELREPDMENIPARFINSCTRTLAFYKLQRMVNESVGFLHSQSVPWMGQALVVCKRNSDDFMLHRVEPSETDSGWFIGCLDQDHDHQQNDNLIGISVFDAMVQKPDIIEFLGLPPGITVVVRRGKPEITYGGQRLPFQTGSYLDLKYGAG